MSFLFFRVRLVLRNAYSVVFTFIPPTLKPTPVWLLSHEVALVKINRASVSLNPMDTFQFQLCHLSAAFGTTDLLQSSFLISTLQHSSGFLPTCLLLHALLYHFLFFNQLLNSEDCQGSVLNPFIPLNFFLEVTAVTSVVSVTSSVSPLSSPCECPHPQPLPLALTYISSCLLNITCMTYRYFSLSRCKTELIHLSFP